ncbi:MAG: phosphoglucosamine mutase [Candidatus Aminicenantes bacterium]|nr:phosphoglucosamine mutase [Candidatus Aminicenantes bacterium]
MGQLFGTDGVRARAGEYPLDYPTIFNLGKSLIYLFKNKTSQPRTLIGWDPRESSPWIAKVIAEGIASAGGLAELAGVLPTSAISFLTRLHRYEAGIVVSASHNPYEDNGIKIFQSDGFKLKDSQEEILEKMILEKNYESFDQKFKANQLALENFFIKKNFQIDLEKDYLQFLSQNFIPGRLSTGLKIVIDCSNGASSTIAPHLFDQLGFQVKVINNQPDGRNINANCGSLFPEGLSKKVLQEQADLGVAYDGDADRAILVDEKGRILNGDFTLFIQARWFQQRKKLRSPYIVATVMSNMGLEIALSRLGLKLIRSKVGDRYVLEEMLRRRASLGGERSGHTIFLDILPAGDGLLTSLKIVETMIESGLKLSELAADLIEFPQLLINVPVSRKTNFSEIPGFETTIKLIREKLGPFGRIEVRYSGTEPVVRVMVEGEDEELVKQSAQEIAALIKKYLG